MSKEIGNMVVGECFDNDPIWIQDVQHDLYMSDVAAIFNIARDVYLKAEKTLGITTTLGSDIKEINSLDHRTIQYVYDIIAASFRYQNLDEINQQIPGQLHVPGFKNFSDKDSIEAEWLRYYHESIKNLYEDYPLITKQVLIAVAYSYPDKRGIDAESSIMEMLYDIYYFGDSAHYPIRAGKDQ